MSDAERDKTMIDDLLALKEKADHLVKEAFGGDTAFVGAIREAFETAVNKRQNKPAELLGITGSSQNYHTAPNAPCVQWNRSIGQQGTALHTYLDTILLFL